MDKSSIPLIKAYELESLGLGVKVIFNLSPTPILTQNSLDMVPLGSRSKSAVSEALKL
jgi:hypothetical protein